LAFAALLVLAGLLALRRPQTVRLTVDGVSRNLETHAGSIGQLLSDEQLTFGPADLVDPPTGKRLTTGTRVVVEHARPVMLTVDGRSVALLSRGRTPRAVVTGAAIGLGPGDRLQVNGRDWPVDRPLAFHRRVVQLAVGPGRAVPVPDEMAAPPLDGESEVAVSADVAPVEITIARAVPVTILEDGVPYAMNLAGATVGEALSAAGLALGPGDEALPAPDSVLAAGMTIRLKRGTPFLLTVNGEERAVRANGATVGEAVQRSGLEVGPDDYTVPAAETPLEPGMAVALVRVRTETETEEVDIDFGHEEVEDPEAELDTVTVVQAGAVGRKRVTSRVRYENERVKHRQVVSEDVLQEPVTEVAKVGTKVVWHTVDTPEGPKQYWRKLRVYANSYSASRSGTPKSAPWYGHTRSGMMMRKGIVAVDTAVIPMGTNLYVPDYGVGIAGDTGGGVRGFHIDLGYDDDNYQSWHSSVDLYLLEPLPPASRLRNLRRQ
jgi:uncharacterized protein YabE (DUF348 family)